MPGVVHEADVCFRGTVVRLGECVLQAAFLKMAECGIVSLKRFVGTSFHVLSPGQAA